MPVSDCQCSEVWGLELQWASLGNGPCSERGPIALPAVSAAVGLLVFPPARLTCRGAHGDSSGGLPGNPVFSAFSLSKEAGSPG